MSDRRRKQLQQIVQDHGFAALGELATTLAVSESTVRRDLEALEKQSLVRRTHGGAFWSGGSDTLSIFSDRHDDSWAAKNAIAIAASEMVDDHDTILLDGGSTTYELARRLVDRPLQVVTNSLPVAQLLSMGTEIDLIMIGGCIRGRTAVSIGPMAQAQLAGIQVTTAFLSIAGLNERGFYNSDMMLVESEQAMLAAADTTVVVADSSKFGKVSLSRICGLGDVNTVVTDSQLESHWKTTFETAGSQLVLASIAQASPQ